MRLCKIDSRLRHDSEIARFIAALSSYRFDSRRWEGGGGRAVAVWREWRWPMVVPYKDG